MRTLRWVLLACVATLLAGCGSGGGSGDIALPKAKTVHLVDVRPVGTVEPGKPFVLSFRIQNPDGSTLTTYKTGPGPHTGVHVIIVRRDLSSIVHLHPKPAADGTVRQVVTLPTAGPYQALIDVYATIPGQPFPNFQLHRNIRVAGSYTPRPLPPFKRVVVDKGYTFRLTTSPRIASLTAAPVVVHVTGPDGKPARFTPWFGALAHAIFFKPGTLYYFHTHVCSPDAPNCAGRAGAPTTRTTKPGLIDARAILPVAGTWQLFVQGRVDGHVLTAPFTLRAS